MSVPWPCAHEFLAVVSNPRIFREPTPIDVALDAVGWLQDSFDGGFLAEGEGYLPALGRIVRPALLQRAIVHDARLPHFVCTTACACSGLRTATSRDFRIWR